MANYVSSFANGAAVDEILTTVQGSNLSADHKITRSATLVIAASDSSEKSKAQADYVCDGTADNVEIQAALDALPGTGGEIKLLEGSFQITSEIIYESVSDILLCGTGKSTKLITGDNSCIRVGHRTDAEKAATDITFRDFYIDGTAQHLATTTPEILQDNNFGIDIESPNGETKNIYMYNLHIYNTGNDAIYGYAPGYAVIDGCFLDHIRGYWGGVHPHNGQDSWLIRNSYFDTCSRHGTRHGSVIGCVFINCGDHIGADYFASIHGFPGPIIGNRVTGSLGYAIDSHESGNNQIIANNRIDTPATIAIYLRTNNNVISGNQITGGYRGVTGAVNSVNNLVVGNYISGTSDVAIKMLTNTGHIIRDNYGYVTENTGTSTIATGQTTVDVTHGLAAAPTRVLLSPTTATAGKQYYVSAKAATTFTITIDSEAEADISFDWQATL
jgi:hypothetical protein